VSRIKRRICEFGKQPWRKSKLGGSIY